MAVVTSVSPEVAALLKSKGYQQASWNNGAWYDPNDPNGNYLDDRSLATLTGATAPVAGAVLDRETGVWTLNGQPVSLKNAQGQVWINNETPGSKGGQLTGTGYWATPTGGGGGFLDSVLGGVANAISSVASPIADLGPAAPLAIIGGGLAANAGLLGTGGTSASGAASVAPEVAGAASAVPVNTTTLAGVDAASTAAGANAAATYPGLAAGAGIGSAGGAMTLDEITKFITDNKSVLGAAAGALASGPSSTTTTADKSPWAPAQDWMKANIARGQELQKQYQANPFSAFQQQAYNNQAGLGNSFRSAVNSFVPQMNSFKPYQRTPQSQVASPYQFTNPNLGFTSKPFGA